MNKGMPIRKQLNGYIYIGLGISLLTALLLSPFASPHPDGLKKVADLKGFSGKAEGGTFWKYAPLHDYTFLWIKNKKVSTALSGLIGTLAIFLVTVGIGRLIKK